MRGRALLAALATGVAAFLVVTVAVTEAAQPWIEFSLFLGLPAGVAAGAFATALTYLWLGDVDAQRRRVAMGLASFGVVFLVVLVAVGELLEYGAVLTLFVAAVAGASGAVAAYLGGASARRSEKPAR